jgi:hypothetical protein
MLGSMLVVDPPPGSALRLLAVTGTSAVPVGLQHRRPIDCNGQSRPQCGRRRRRPWPAGASRRSSFLGVACSLGTGTWISY